MILSDSHGSMRITYVNTKFNTRYSHFRIATPVWASANQLGTIFLNRNAFFKGGIAA